MQLPLPRHLQRVLPIIILVAAILPGAPAAAQSSHQIRNSIFRSIESDPSIKGYEVEIEARQGTVWLRGKVSSEKDRAHILELAQKTSGVTEVHDELSILDPVTPQAPALARSVQARIRPATSTVNHAVTIAAQGSTITLSGIIGSEALRRKVEQLTRETPGVTQVVNELKVSRPSDAAIAIKIRELIAQEPQIKIKELAVDVASGVVTLHGVADGHRSIDHALALALNADGVEDVRTVITTAPSNAAKQPRPAPKQER